MTTATRTRMKIDGLSLYTAIVRNADGSSADETEFSDWFIDDKSAVAGLTEILGEQGYAVASVVIGFPCVVTIE